VDSPLLLSAAYHPYKGKIKESFIALVDDVFNSFNNINIFVNRRKGFQQAGRVQDYNEAVKKDKEILEVLNWYDYHEIEGTPEAVWDIREILRKEGI